MAVSRFLKLPFETRHQVYKSLYASLTLTYLWCKHPLLSSLPREIREDSLPTLYGNACFKFNTTEHLMDFLTSIDDASLRRLRHVSARSHPLPVTPVPEDSPNYVTYSFPTVLQLFPELQLSTLVVRDTYHEPGTQQDGFGDEASYEMVEDLIKSDGFKELIYISGSDSFMNTNEFVTIPAKYPANGAEKFVETTRRDPQPSTWDKLIKERDGTASGARVEMFRHTKDGRVPLKSEFERSKKPSGVESRVVVPNTEFPTPSGVEDRGRREAIEIRIKRGEGADYVQTGQKCGREEGWLHELFRLVTWADIKKQGMIVEVRDESPSDHL